ncbi:MAG TPA: bifunctional metallophosphatase/5'-nucleotidase [Oxalicibacterium sp.]|jgi:5'-nucleotidase|nr:bifunctional metallophosphatase/5'-nucleotidase [Oxalicibacterium sp.]
MKRLDKRTASRLHQRLLVYVAAALLSACSVPPFSPDKSVDIHIVAMNDLHGHLEAESVRIKGVGDEKPRERVLGGVATIGGALRAWRSEDPQLLLVGGGDLIGASPALSSLWADEPTIVALNALDMRVSTVGNHEFDQGSAELLRQQHGGCASTRAEKACKFQGRFDGANFSYVGANVVDNASGHTFLLPYRIAQAHGIKIAFIGAVLKNTPSMVNRGGIAGLRFIDEADAINRWVPEVKAQGASAIVAVIHQGGETPEPFDKQGCSQLSGPIVDIVKRLDPEIRLVITAHTHQGYICSVDGRTVTQGASYGHMLTRITLSIDPGASDLRDKMKAIHVDNVLMDPQRYAADPALSELVQQLKIRSQPLLAKPVARLAVPRISRKMNDAGESPLGDLIADSQLAATRHLGAQFAITNAGSMRGDLESDAGQANYAQLATVMPFENTLVVVSISGEQLLSLLEQQSRMKETSSASGSMLQISRGLNYRWDAGRPPGQRLLRDSVKVNGAALVPQRMYRIAVNSFLAQGGDGFKVLTHGVDRVDSGIKDIDALTRYLAASERDGHPAGKERAEDRIVRIN